MYANVCLGVAYLYRSTGKVGTKPRRRCTYRQDIVLSLSGPSHCTLRGSSHRRRPLACVPSPRQIADVPYGDERSRARLSPTTGRPTTPPSVSAVHCRRQSTHNTRSDRADAAASTPDVLSFESAVVQSIDFRDSPTMNDDDDVFFFAAAAVYPTAGYLFADELDMQCSALDELHAMLLQEPTERPFASSCCTLSTAVVECVSPTSPSSVTHLRPCGDSDETSLLPKHIDDIDRSGGRPSTCTNYNSAVIKPEVAAAAATITAAATTVTTTTLRSTCPPEVPLPAVAHDVVETSDDEDRERLRRRQRGYEKRYRGRKRRDLKMQRDLWLALEMKLDDARKRVCRPYVRVEAAPSDALRVQLLLLKLEERALRHDRVAMRSLQAWEHISRIREYSDKNQLRTASEWRHSADKVIGRCAVLGPRRFHPYAPLLQRHFRW